MYKQNIPINFSSSPFHNNHQIINDRKKSKDDNTKEGVLVNTYIKDSEYKIADRYDLSTTPTPLPEELFKKNDKNNEKWYKNPALPLIAAPVIFLAAGAGLAAAYKKSITNKYKLPEKLRFPSNGRIIAVNKDTSIALISLVQDPTWKNFQVAAAVLTSAATAFTLKNVVDGMKEVWVKKQEADIKRDKEERLINIETRSFAGKNQIIRSLMSQKAEELDAYSNLPNKLPEENKLIGFTDFKKKLGFKFGSDITNFSSDKNINREKKESSNNVIYFALLGGAAVVLTALFTKSIFKNIRTVAKDVEKAAANVKSQMQAELKSIKNRNELESKLGKMTNLTDKEKDIAIEEWIKIHHESALASPPKELSGNDKKIGHSAMVIADATSFVYTWLVHKNPQTGLLAGLMCAAAGLGYVGQAVVKAVKEVQVEKANANTEVELQDRLVQVELKNFYAKKNSYVQPLMEDSKIKIKSANSQEEKNRIKENVLSEIKNGPPYVYS